MSLESNCCWELDNSGCLRGFDVEHSCYVLFVRNLFLPFPPGTPLKGSISPLGRTQFPLPPPPPIKGLNFAYNHTQTDH